MSDLSTAGPEANPAERDEAIVLVAGWNGSGPGHWQHHWAEQYGDVFLEQSDWIWPKRGDWMARLEETIRDCDNRDVVLVGHSLGCQLIAQWAGISPTSQRITGAMLVAPADLDAETIPPRLLSWRPVPAQPLPFPCLVVTSDNDEYVTAERASTMASQWRAQICNIGRAGHINADSGVGAWPEGRSLLQAFILSTCRN